MREVQIEERRVCEEGEGEEGKKEEGKKDLRQDEGFP